ncbi:hypothetical protein C8Q77DRAFT_1157093 [Trametes polyzona]|nr:hypothetical protein C8Q77DRAFT_1157093 [Trametes polyzona]
MTSHLLSHKPSSTAVAPDAVSSILSIGRAYQPKKTHGPPSPTSHLPPPSASFSSAGTAVIPALLVPAVASLPSSSQVAEEDSSTPSSAPAEEDPSSLLHPPAQSVAPSRLVIRLPPARQPVVSHTARTPSPVPPRESLRVEYTPPMQTTTRSGRVSQPAAKYDP